MNKLKDDHCKLIAEYLALARTLKEKSPVKEYRRANELSWYLAMVLPEGLYCHMVRAISDQTEHTNPLTTVIEARGLLGTKDRLTSDGIAHHAPGVGNKNRRKR